MYIVATFIFFDLFLILLIYSFIYLHIYLYIHLVHLVIYLSFIYFTKNGTKVLIFYFCLLLSLLLP